MLAFHFFLFFFWYFLKIMEWHLKNGFVMAWSEVVRCCSADMWFCVSCSVVREAKLSCAMM